MKVSIRIHGMLKEEEVIDFEKQCSLSVFRDGENYEIWIDFGNFPDSMSRPMGMIRVKLSEMELKKFLDEIKGKGKRVVKS